MARGRLSHESLLAHPLHTGCLHRFLLGNWTCKLLAFLLSLAEARRRGNHLAKPRSHPSMVSRTGLQVWNDNVLYIDLFSNRSPQWAVEGKRKPVRPAQGVAAEHESPWDSEFKSCHGSVRLFYTSGRLFRRGGNACSKVS